MNIKWKIAIHIAATLIIGILIGALLNRTLVHRRIRGMLEMRTAGLLAPRPERNLKPVSPEQEKRIREILDSHAERLAEIHKRFDGEIQSAFKSLKQEIDPILTPEQRDQFKRMIPGPPRFPRRVRPGFPPFERREVLPFMLEALQKELNLSEDQNKKVQAILEEFGARAPAPGEKPEGAGVPGPLRQIREKLDQEIEKILTDEQKEKFRQLMKRRPPEAEEDQFLPPPFPR
jgi:DNA-binding MarR family transcriptional regulator